MNGASQRTLNIALNLCLKTTNTMSIPLIIQEQIAKGGALKEINLVHYPKRYNLRVPLKVKMKETVMSELLFFLIASEEDVLAAIGGNEYYVSVNSLGAVSAIFDNGTCLGLKPDEFEVIEFHK